MANVIIQISSHFGSQRQEAQRLGRILRPKQEVSKQALSNQQDFNAYFYSLVSTDTDEMKYAEKRQQFLIGQGYFFQVVREIPKNRELYKMDRKEEQQKLLQDVMKLETARGNTGRGDDNDESDSDEDAAWLKKERKRERQLKKQVE